MEATRKQKQSHCVHTTEDGTRCGKTIQHWADKLCRRHFSIRNGVISRTPHTHARNDAPTSDNGLLQSHSSRRHPIQEEKEEEEEEEEKVEEEEEDKEKEEGAIASPSMTGAITCRRDLMTTATMIMMTNTATALPFLEVNNAGQAQADQECQQH